MIDEKNLNVYIRDYTDKIKRQHDIFGYGIAFITITLALLTSTFHDLGLKADVWNALFILCDFGVFILMLKAAYYTFKMRNETPDQLISKIKAQAESRDEVAIGMSEFK